MTTNYHTPWVDGSTEFKEAHMNVPPSELDTQIGLNVIKIAAALAASYIVCNDEEVICNNNEVVTNEPL